MERIRVDRAAHLTTLTKRQVAVKLNVTPLTIMEWVKKGVFPKPIVITEQTLRWRVADVERWFEERQQTQDT